MIYNTHESLFIPPPVAELPAISGAARWCLVRCRETRRGRPSWFVRICSPGCPARRCCRSPRTCDHHGLARPRQPADRPCAERGERSAGAVAGDSGLAANRPVLRHGRGDWQPRCRSDAGHHAADGGGAAHWVRDKQIATDQDEVRGLTHEGKSRILGLRPA